MNIIRVTVFGVIDLGGVGRGGAAGHFRKNLISSSQQDSLRLKTRLSLRGDWARLLRFCQASCREGVGLLIDQFLDDRFMI